MPTRSTTASATSAIRSPARRRPCRGSPDPSRPERRAWRSPDPVTRSAGTRPISRVTARVVPAENARTPASTRVWPSSGISDGARETSAARPDLHGHHAEAAAQDGHHEALREKLSQQPPPPGAQRRPQGYLALPGQGPGQQEVGQVGAGDQEDEDHHAEQRQQQGPYAGDEVGAEGHEVHAPALHGLRVLLPQACLDPLHLGARLPERDALRKAADDVPLVRLVDLPCPRRRTAVRRTPGRRGGESRSRGASTPTTVYGSSSSCRVRPTTEESPPNRVRHSEWDRRTAAAAPRTPSWRVNSRPSSARVPRIRKHARRHRHRAHTGGPSVAIHHGGRERPSVGADRLERRGVVAPGQVVAAGHDVVVPASGMDIPHLHQSVRVRVRQGAEEDGVHDAEHGRGGPDPEGQRENRHRREPRPRPQLPPPVAHVVAELVEPLQAPAAALGAGGLAAEGPAGPLQVPELLQGSSFGRRPVDPLRQELVDARLEVEADLGVHVVRDLAAELAVDPEEPANPRRQPTHDPGLSGIPRRPRAA